MENTVSRKKTVFREKSRYFRSIGPCFVNQLKENKEHQFFALSVSCLHLQCWQIREKTGSRTNLWVYQAIKLLTVDFPPHVIFHRWKEKGCAFTVTKPQHRHRHCSPAAFTHDMSIAIISPWKKRKMVCLQCFLPFLPLTARSKVSQYRKSQR